MNGLSLILVLAGLAFLILAILTLLFGIGFLLWALVATARPSDPDTKP